MSLPLTPARIAAVYDCLREFPPFNRWKLPRTADVEFCVTQHADQHADAEIVRNWKRVRVSEKRNGHFNTIASSVAHEMVHLAMHAAGLPNWETHGAEFQRRALAVCRLFGWDEKVF